MGNDEFIEIAARYDRLAAHELLWRPVAGADPVIFDFCTTRGLKLGQVAQLGGSWVCSYLREVVAVRPDRQTAMDAVEACARQDGAIS